MMAASVAVRKHKPAKVIIAVPVAAEETCMALTKEVGKLVGYETPEPFWAVGAWYKDFTQTTNAEADYLLDKAAQTWKAA
jgi:putative phosphoribosyl transferase